MNIHESILQFFSPQDRWYRCRLDFPINVGESTLETVIGRYLIYCSMTQSYENVESILGTLEMFGGIIPRTIIRDGRTAQELNASERKKGLWVSEKDKDGNPVAIRHDAGIGQCPLAIIGLYSVKSPVAFDWATNIARHSFCVTYYGKIVTQGGFFSYWPLPTNNCIEAVCLSEISGIQIPWKQTARCRVALDFPMPTFRVEAIGKNWGDNPVHRTLLLWFLARFGDKQKKRFQKWIRTRDSDLPKLEATYNEVSENINHRNYLSGTLNYLIAKEMRK